VARILVVDDEPDVRLLARVVLTQAGYDVEECLDGATALARILTDPRPDAVVLDVRMPGLSGWDVLEQLPDDAPPVLVVTADTTSLQRPRTLLLSKPYRPAELLAAIEAALAAKPGSP
jgi:CheY-like chemotaxis protein